MLKLLNLLSDLGPASLVWLTIVGGLAALFLAFLLGVWVS